MSQTLGLRWREPVLTFFWPWAGEEGVGGSKRKKNETRSDSTSTSMNSGRTGKDLDFQRPYLYVGIAGIPQGCFPRQDRIVWRKLV